MRKRALRWVCRAELPQPYSNRQALPERTDCSTRAFLISFQHVGRKSRAEVRRLITARLAPDLRQRTNVILSSPDTRCS